MTQVNKETIAMKCPNSRNIHEAFLVDNLRFLVNYLRLLINHLKLYEIFFNCLRIVEIIYEFFHNIVTIDDVLIDNFGLTEL